MNIDNPYFEGMINQIYQPELQLIKANISDTEAPFLDLHLSVANGFVSSKIYDKRDDFDFDIVNFPFLDGDVPRRASYGVYISQLITGIQRHPQSISEGFRHAHWVLGTDCTGAIKVARSNQQRNSSL